LLAFVSRSDDVWRKVGNDGTKYYILVAKNVMGFPVVNPLETIHRRCFYLRDDGDPSILVGKWDF
jgi:hypothetical protein